MQQIPLLHQQIIINTEKLRDLHRSLMLHASVIPADELDHFLIEIRRLYENALQLQHANSQALLLEMEKSIREQLPVVELPPVTVPPPAIRAETTADPSAEKIPAPSVESAKPETAVSSKPEIEEEKISAINAVVAEITAKVDATAVKKKPVSELHDRYEEHTTLADTFSGSERVGDKLARQPSRRLSDQLKSPVKDLRTAIGLNEKFLFINQLFSGDAVKYNTAIDFLNNCSDHRQAHEYLDRVSTENNWEAHPSAASTFVDLIDRRVSA